MQGALEAVDSFPHEAFHSDKASALKFAVATGMFAEASYHDCTFSIPIKTDHNKGEEGRKDLTLWGWMILTVDENFDQLKENIRVDDYFGTFKWIIF